jgi:hypothetical protein
MHVAQHAQLTARSAGASRLGSCRLLTQSSASCTATALILTVDQLITFAPALYMTHLTE